MVLMMAKADFRDIYSEHKDKVWRLVSKYVIAQQHREDLFQEVFLKIHQALPRFRGESAVETWIFRITVNTAINYIKKQKRYKLFRDILVGFKPEESIPPQDAGWSSLLKPLEKLNPQQRTILILADIEERKLDEIAQMMNIPTGTVKSNLHRAREIIKKELKENGGL